MSGAWGWSRCDQSILTGESGSVEKQVEAVHVPNAVVQDKTCMMFSVSAAPRLALPSGALDGSCV